MTFAYSSFFLWRDIIEIAVLASIIYYISLWLKKDRQKNLLLYLYGYCTLIAVAYNLQFTTLSHLLIICSPVTLMIFALIHQETLQKNFVALCNITPARTTNSDWLDTMMQTALTTMNNHKNIVCIIERSQALDELITTPLPLRADVTKGVLTVFLNSQLFDAEKMMWLNTHGILLGINAQWAQVPDDVWRMAPSNEPITLWKHDALFFTNKVDALIVKTNAEQRSFDIIVHGKEYAALNTRAALHVLKKYIAPQSSEIQGVTHEYEHAKNRPEQPNN